MPNKIVLLAKLLFTGILRTLSGENRTNNHAEATNRKLQVEFGMEHPTIWKFVNTLHKIQKSRDTFLEQLIAGHAPPSKLKKIS